MESYFVYNIFIYLFVFLQNSDMLACHNYWHWALYFIEKVWDIFIRMFYGPDR